jgi:hypothetical protein
MFALSLDGKHLAGPDFLKRVGKKQVWNTGNHESRISAQCELRKTGWTLIPIVLHTIGSIDRVHQTKIFAKGSWQR